MKDNLILVVRIALHVLWTEKKSLGFSEILQKVKESAIGTQETSEFDLTTALVILVQKRFIVFEQQDSSYLITTLGDDQAHFNYEGWFY